MSEGLLGNEYDLQSSSQLSYYGILLRLPITYLAQARINNDKPSAEHQPMVGGGIHPNPLQFSDLWTVWNFPPSASSWASIDAACGGEGWALECGWSSQLQVSHLSFILFWPIHSYFHSPFSPSATATELMCLLEIFCTAYLRFVPI